MDGWLDMKTTKKANWERRWAFFDDKTCEVCFAVDKGVRPDEKISLKDVVSFRIDVQY